MNKCRRPDQDILQYVNWVYQRVKHIPYSYDKMQMIKQEFDLSHTAYSLLCERMKRAYEYKKEKKMKTKLNVSASVKTIAVIALFLAFSFGGASLYQRLGFCYCPDVVDMSNDLLGIINDNIKETDLLIADVDKYVTLGEGDELALFSRMVELNTFFKSLLRFESLIESANVYTVTRLGELSDKVMELQTKGVEAGILRIPPEM